MPENESSMPPELRDSLSQRDTERAFDSVDEIPTDPLTSPRMIEGRFGPVVFGTHEGAGYSPERRSEGLVNQDALVVNTDTNGFAVIDGLGGEAHGEQAARILAEELQRAFKEELSFEEAHERAHARMKDELAEDGGACYIATRIDEDGNLAIGQAGDVHLALLGRNGRIRFETRDEGKGSHVYNAVTGSDQTYPTEYSPRGLFAGDRIMIGSDGVFKTVSPEDAARLLHGKTTSDGFLDIQQEVLKRMSEGQSEPDNATLLIIEIARGSEFDTVDDLALDFLSVRTFDELYDMLREKKTLVDKSKEWSSEELMNLIEEVRRGSRPLTDVPSVAGLRKNVHRVHLLEEKRM